MSKRHAFTLIELLVVIAIIAILASILFPVFAMAKNAAKKTTSISNVKQISLAGVLYAGDYDDVSVPLYWFNPYDQSQPSTQGFYYWGVLLLPYTKSEAVLYAPSDTNDDPSLHGAGCVGGGRFDPNDTCHLYLVGLTTSYGFNYRYLNTQQPGGYLGFYYQGNSLTALSDLSNTVQFGESTLKDKSAPGTNTPITTDIGYARIEPPFIGHWDNYTYPDARSQGQLWPRFTKDQVIIGWMDGHVKSKAINQLKGQGTDQQNMDRWWNGLGPAGTGN